VRRAHSSQLHHGSIKSKYGFHSDAKAYSGQLQKDSVAIQFLFGSSLRQHCHRSGPTARLRIWVKPPPALAIDLVRPLDCASQKFSLLRCFRGRYCHVRWKHSWFVRCPEIAISDSSTGRALKTRDNTEGLFSCVTEPLQPMDRDVLHRRRRHRRQGSPWRSPAIRRSTSPQKRRRAPRTGGYGQARSFRAGRGSDSISASPSSEGGKVLPLPRLVLLASYSPDNS
jgi:hypothetical protein